MEANNPEGKDLSMEINTEKNTIERGIPNLQREPIIDEIA